MLLDCGLPFDWWGEAVNTAVYHENCSPDSTIAMKSPYELWFGKAADLSCLKPFGCRAILFNEKHIQWSISSPSRVECVLLGYEEGHCSYRVWDPISHKIHILHHVWFKPSTFPFLNIQSVTSTSPSDSDLSSFSSDPSSFSSNMSGLLFFQP